MHYDAALRIKVAELLGQWEGNASILMGYDLLKVILKVPAGETLPEWWTSEAKAVCERLAGPYGYVVYKAWKLLHETK